MDPFMMASCTAQPGSLVCVQLPKRQSRLIVVPADDARVLVHDAHQQDPTLHRLLALMGQERNLEVAANVQDELPIALGVIRDVEAPTYDAAVNEQIQNVRASAKAHTFDELTATLEQWS